MSVVGVDVPIAGSLLEKRRLSFDRRRLKSSLLKFIFWLSLGLVFVPAIWLVGGVIAHSLPNFRLSILLRTSKGNNVGMLNAIVGTLYILLSVVLTAGTLGILAGIYVAEHPSAFAARVFRSASELLSGVPSIVLGFVGYAILVARFSLGFGLLPALITIDALVLPYIIKTTEVSISRVSQAYREGAVALGLTPLQVLRKTVLRPALPGILTGVSIALAISVGETAPLLYTAGWSDNLPTLHLTHAPLGYLTYLVWSDFNQPYANARELAYTAGLILAVVVVLLIITSKLLIRLGSRYLPQSSGSK